ncbi:MAG: hypothetical protein HZA29_03615 [Candidatus Omnitrophica bacterium]|nr:hypothetical protein [Candidatus Omnitrophota bacterium]
MLRYLKTNNAQAVMGEYVLVLFVVVGMVTAMTIYFKRAVQARIVGARDKMFNIVLNRTAGYYTGSIYREYEPYYANTESSAARSEDTRTELLPGATTGIFRKTLDEVTAVQTRSETAPPKDAK